MSHWPTVNPPIYGYVRMAREVLKLDPVSYDSRLVKRFAELDIVKDGSRYVLRCCEHGEGAPMNDNAEAVLCSVHADVGAARDAMNALRDHYVRRGGGAHYYVVCAYPQLEGATFNAEDADGEGPWNPRSMVGPYSPCVCSLSGLLAEGAHSQPLFG